MITVHVFEDLAVERTSSRQFRYACLEFSMALHRIKPETVESGKSVPSGGIKA